MNLLTVTRTLARHSRGRLLVFALLSLVLLRPAHARPYVNGEFKGRIAWSADGNHNDPDDWIASPLALAIFAGMGLRDRLVHFDYNCILTDTNAEWEKIHAESVLGAADHWGYQRGVFVDVRKDKERAIDSIARAINASSENDPLYFVVAGPMEIPVLGIRKSDPAKRKFVYCISHSRWNEGFSPQYKFTYTKRSVIEQGVHWVQLPDQNRLLAFGRFQVKSPPEEFAPYFWLRDSTDPKLKFLWERMLVSTRPDPSDAGMAWFLVTGDEEATPQKVRQLLAEQRRPAPVPARPHVRIEAENFFTSRPTRSSTGTVIAPLRIASRPRFRRAHPPAGFAPGWTKCMSRRALVSTWRSAIWMRRSRADDSHFSSTASRRARVGNRRAPARAGRVT